MAKSISFGSNCYAITSDDDYVYCGAADSTVYKLAKEDLSVIATYAGPSTCNGMCNDSTYLYLACGSGFVYKVTKSTMALAATSPDYTNVIYAIAEYGNYIYYGGGADAGGHYHVKKLLKTDMATIIESATYGALIRAITTDGTSVYVGGSSPPAVVRKLTVAALAFVADSVAYTNDIQSICLSNGNIFIIGNAIGRGGLWKFDTSLNFLAENALLGMCIQGEDAYVYSATTLAVSKVDNRQLWTRSDHEITVTNDGSARCNPVIGLIANGGNYWTQSIENQTTDQTWEWSDSQADGEELEADSNLWYCTLEGVSAMAGVSGKWIQLAPGSNVLYIENVVGEFIIDWRPRYA